MEVRAISKSVRVSPRKVRLMADSVRSMSVVKAYQVLQGAQKRGATPLMKTLKSAVANAVNNAKLDQNDLVIKTIMVNEGMVMKRFRPSTRGRIHPYKKRGSNIYIVLESVAQPAVAQPLVTKEDKEAVKKAEEKKTAKKTETKKAKKEETK
jgi:large subunit ribosomal protein L22